MLPLPPIIGHRGAAASAPENTLASFRQAALLGARMVEFDVRLTADGVPVVFHDDRLERTSSGRGRVADATAAQLRRLDAGAWFDPRFAGERIPTLAEVLALCLDLGLAVNIEIKPDQGRERVTALTALEEAGRMWPADRPPPLVSSFSADALAAALEVAPHWPRGLLVERLPHQWQRQVETLGCAAIHAHHAQLTEALIAHIKAGGTAILAYTVNDAERARHLLHCGVTALFSDLPDLLLPIS